MIIKKKLKIIKIKLISYVRTEITKNTQDIYIFLLFFLCSKINQVEAYTPKNKEIIPSDCAAGEKIFVEFKFGKRRSINIIEAILLLYLFSNILNIKTLNMNILLY